MNRTYLLQRCTKSGKEFTMESRTGEYWRMDYMGSSEFEFGAIPAFQRQFNSNLKEKVTISVTENGNTLFALVSKDISEEYKKVLSQLMKDELRLKEASYIPQMFKKEKYFTDYCLWMDLDNEAVISIDKEQLTLFRVTVQNSVKYMDEQKAKANS